MAKKFLYSGQLKQTLFLLIASASFTLSFSQSTIFPSTSVPSIPLYNAGTPIETGVKFRVTQAGYITGVRFYKGAGNTGTHIGHLWSSAGAKLAEATFTGETASGWQQVSFSIPVAVAAGTTYVASYFSSAGNIALSYPYFTSAVVNGPLRALADGEDGGNGIYIAATSSTFPTNTILSANFWVDIVFSTSINGGGADVTPPTVVSVSPANLSINLNAGTVISALFSEAMNHSTINNSTFELRNTFTNELVPSTIVYNAASRTATLFPSSILNGALLYTATIRGGASGVKDEAGNAMVNNYSWSFIMIPLFDLTPPTVLSVLPANGATGVSINPVISAVFSEEMNAGTINASGFELSNALNVPVPFTVSYSAGTRTATLLPSVTLAGSTAYKTTIKEGAAGVKDAAGNAMTNNYVWSFTTADVTPPTIVSVSPVNGATGVSTGAAVSVKFSEAMNASTINASTFELRNPSNAVVTATITYNATNKIATLAPSSALTSSTVYRAIVKGGASGVKDVAGNAMTNEYTWTFTTAENVAPPLTIFQPTDAPVTPLIIEQPIEAGVKFRAGQNGFIKGIRFYKGAGNTGTHIGHLWSRTGEKLGEATFINETASGWQQVLFANPIAISANTTYIASYFSSEGGYGFTNSYFTSAVVNGPLRALADGEDGGNGVYIYTPASAFPINTFMSTNYYADVLFTPGPDEMPPVIIAVSPVNGAMNVNINTTLAAVFNEPINASAINSSTVELRNTSNNSLVAAAITYNAVTNTVILTPLAPLSNSTIYAAKIKGGSSGVKDVAGNAMTNDYAWTFTTTDPPLLTPAEGFGGPILVISTTANPFSRYTTEILRAEGLNEFAAADISTVTATVLNNYDVVVLGEMTVTADQVTLFTNWVNAGGTLIAFKPASLLTPLLGIANTNGTLSDKYLLVNTSTDAGAGIVNQTIQFHSTANLYTLNEATSIATLYSAANTATNFPAVTTRNVGANGGRAIAFTYDLARSIVYTRQGNPAWAGQKRDGQIDPIRSDDQFFPDWIDFNKVAIPQADEQQRLLANIILQGNLHRKPLPRFWYLPRDLKAAIVMTGDDHSNNGTEGRFDQFKTLGPNTAQDVADWKAIRGTSYIYPNTPITNSQAMVFESEGFEIALHPTTGCTNYTPASLLNDFTTQLGQFTSNYPGLSPSATNRTHCLTWSDWCSTPRVEWQKGIRLDATYYYWPEVWMQNRSGMFTGSGMPMRYADLDGSFIDVYQGPTQITDETNMDYTAFCNAVLDKAIGPEGYYGVFTVNMHNDFNPSAGSDAIIASAQARQIPVISAKQMLTWLDGRNNSSFGNMTWSNNQLIFNVTARSSARNLKAMLPIRSQSGQLISITRNSNAVPFTTQMIKGIQYAFFAPITGTSTYIATYAPVPVTTVPTPTKTTATTKTSGTASADVPGKASPVSTLYVNVVPNPGISYFNVVISSNDANPVTVRVRDLFGRVLETHEKVTSTGILRVGLAWAAGTYFAEIIQGDRRKVVKLIKVN